MALTAQVVAHFLDVTDGEVRFILSVPVANPVLGEIIEAIYIASVDATGNMALDLPINGDPNLVPQGSYWRVSHRLAPPGSRTAEYPLFLDLADAGQTVDLADRIGIIQTEPIYGFLVEITSIDGSLVITTPTQGVRDLSVVGGGGGGGSPPSNATPQPDTALGSPGLLAAYSRGDHSHPLSPLYGPVDKHFVFTQPTPATVWTVPHNLGKHPAVTVVDSAGTEYQVGVEYPNLNTVIIRASAAFSGVAYCN